MHGKRENAASARMCLHVGTYAITAENPDLDPAPFRLTGAFEPRAPVEREPNDTPDQATDMTLDETMSGSLLAKEDVDTYKLSLPEDRTARLGFSFPATESESPLFRLELLLNGKTRWSADIAGSSGGLSVPMQIPKGEYHLRVKPVAWFSGNSSVRFLDIMVRRRKECDR